MSLSSKISAITLAGVLGLFINERGHKVAVRKGRESENEKSAQVSWCTESSSARAAAGLNFKTATGAKGQINSSYREIAPGCVFFLFPFVLEILFLAFIVHDLWPSSRSWSTRFEVFEIPIVRSFAVHRSSSRFLHARALAGESAACCEKKWYARWMKDNVKAL